MDGLFSKFFVGRVKRAERHLMHVEELLRETTEALDAASRSYKAGESDRELNRLGDRVDVMYARRDVARRRYARLYADAFNRGYNV